MAYDLRGKVALVTGAASGIGAASASRLASDGATVLVTDIDDAGAEAVALWIREHGGDAIAMRLDVASAPDWTLVRRRIEDDLGRLDILHSNAYLEIKGSAHDLAEADWNRQLGVSLTG